ncbi:MAG: DUF4363 family protein [Clostridiales bacterium]|nr:DUF4363 family protein [Clostridiales bacterium]
MKKMIIILTVFAVVVGCIIGEMVYENRLYNDLQSDLERIAVSIEKNEEHVDNPETVELCKKLVKKWESGKRVLLILQNHNTVRALDDKIVSLESVVKSDNYNDAVIFVTSAINYIDDILLDGIPFLSNIL